MQPYTVEADSKEEAIKTIVDGGGEIDEGNFHYSHTMDRENWTVEELGND